MDLKLAALRAHGVPNYFGPQRFGRDGYNLDRVAALGAERTKRRAAAPSAALRCRPRASLMFNAVLARRVEAGDWSQLAPGDLASLDGSGSHFRVAAVDEELRRRLDDVRHSPVGSAVGPRRARDAAGQRLDTELAVAREFEAVAELLAAEGLEQERRALRCAVRDLAVEADAGTLTLSFTLGRGQFATAVLREICDFGRAGARSDMDGDSEPRSLSSSDRRLRAQQHVDGAGAAVDGARGGECHDVQVTAQPEIHRDLEHRAARARAIALAVDDSDAAAAGVAAARDEIGELVARRRLTQAVQIQFVLDRDTGRAASGASPACARRRAERTARSAPPLIAAPARRRRPRRRSAAWQSRDCRPRRRRARLRAVRPRFGEAVRQRRASAPTA